MRSLIKGAFAGLVGLASLNSASAFEPQPPIPGLPHNPKPIPGIPQLPKPKPELPRLPGTPTLVPIPKPKLMQPDLVVQGLQSRSGGTAVVRVANIGEAPAGPFRVQMQVFRNGQLVGLAGMPVFGLGIGQTTAVTLQLSGQTLSECKLVFTADSSHQISESNENNNTLAVPPIPLIVPLP